ncbi:uncharacterized protein LOC134681775 isoform X2 [Mytilus trossulus]|uniref:uncharacterized protein LOC134681775 isoform X2 n=1 Tax=Mytilus trossulus TaxID=6551 RepID=UPI0030070E98
MDVTVGGLRPFALLFHLTTENNSIDSGHEQPKQRTDNLKEIISCLHCSHISNVLETAVHASNTVCSCDIRENEMWDPGAGNFARCRNRQERQDKEEETCKASFAISKLKHDIQDSFIMMTDEKLRKLHYRFCNWLFHYHVDSIKMKYFNIPRKMRKKFGCCVACAVTCQMPIH